VINEIYSKYIVIQQYVHPLFKLTGLVIFEHYSILCTEMTKIKILQYSNAVVWIMEGYMA